MRSPGESIKSILDYRNISIKQLAVDLEISYQRMLKIVENIVDANPIYNGLDFNYDEYLKNKFENY